MSKLNWDLKIHMLYISKRFFFSFLSVFFFFFFCILDFKSQNNENCQRVLRSILVLCIIWMFKFAWLHDIIKEKNVNFFCLKIIVNLSFRVVWYIYIYRVPPWRCIEYFCSRFFWVENIHKPARQSLGNRLKTCLNLLKLVEGSSCFIFWF